MGTQALAGLALCGILAQAQRGPLGIEYDNVKDEDMEAEFATRYEAWKKWIAELKFPKEHLELMSGGPGREYMEIVKLGPRAVPYIIAKMESNGAADFDFDYDLESAAYLITRKRFPRRAWPEGTYDDPRTCARMYIKWWNEERKDTPRVFAELYAKWKALGDAGDRGAARKILEEITMLGIDVLPFVMERIEAGEEEMVTVASWMRGLKKQPGGGEAVLKWWRENRADLTLPPPAGGWESESVEIKAPPTAAKPGSSAAETPVAVTNSGDRILNYEKE